MRYALPLEPGTNGSVFAFAIWHPFGPHGRELPEAIIQRKRREIEVNGWTLWSFQHRREEMLRRWHGLLASAGAPALVFCANSAGAVDPSAGVGTTRSYRFIDQDEWRALPEAIKVPHPFRGQGRDASAFVVQRIVHPLDPFDCPVEWLFRNGQWRQDRVPSRGEYVIRPGGTVPIRSVRAVLELGKPFLAVVGPDPA